MQNDNKKIEKLHTQRKSRKIRRNRNNVRQPVGNVVHVADGAGVPMQSFYDLNFLRANGTTTLNF